MAQKPWEKTWEASAPWEKSWDVEEQQPSPREIERKAGLLGINEYYQRPTAAAFVPALVKAGLSQQEAANFAADVDQWAPINAVRPGASGIQQAIETRVSQKIRGIEQAKADEQRGFGANLFDSFFAGLSRANQGVGKIASDLVRPISQDLADTTDQYWSGAAREFKAIEEASRPEIDSGLVVNIGGDKVDLGRSAYGGLQSIVQQAPGLLATLYTKNPGFMAGYGAASAGLPAYAEAREAGYDPTTALTNALVQGGAEYITERIPAGQLVKDLGASRGIGKTIAGQLLAEIPGEQAATAIQDLQETALGLGGKRLGDIEGYLADRPKAAVETLAATLTQAGIQGGLPAAANRLASRIQERPLTPTAELGITQIETPAVTPAAPAITQVRPGIFEIGKKESVLAPSVAQDLLAPTQQELETILSSLEAPREETTQPVEIPASSSDAALPAPESVDAVRTARAAEIPAGISEVTPGVYEIAEQVQPITPQQPAQSVPVSEIPQRSEVAGAEVQNQQEPSQEIAPSEDVQGAPLDATQPIEVAPQEGAQEAPPAEARLEQVGPGINAFPVPDVRAGQAQEIPAQPRRNIAFDYDRVQNIMRTPEASRTPTDNAYIRMARQQLPAQTFDLLSRDVTARFSLDNAERAELQQLKAANNSANTIKANFAANQPPRPGYGRTVWEVESAVKKAVGPLADKVVVVQTPDEAMRAAGLDAQPIMGPGVSNQIEGFFSLKNGKVVLIANNFNDTGRAKWAAWHELHHRGAAVKYGRDLNRKLEALRANKYLSDLTDSVANYRMYFNGDGSVNEGQLKGYTRAQALNLAAEEALVELGAAIETGNYERFKRDYGIDVPKDLRPELRNKIREFIEWLKKLVAQVTGRTFESNRELYDFLREIRGAAGEDYAPVAGEDQIKTAQLERLEPNQHGPQYRGDGFVIRATRHNDDAHEGDFAERSTLPFGHAAFLPAENEAYNFGLFDERDNVIGVLQAQVDPDGDIVAIHDIDLRQDLRNTGLGTKVVASIVGSTDKPIEIIDMIPDAREYWRSVGVESETTPTDSFIQNGQLDQRGFAESRRGQAFQQQEEAVGGRAEPEGEPTAADVEVTELSEEEAASLKFGVNSRGQVELPEETKPRAAQRKIQDRFNRFTTLQNEILAAGGDIGTSADVYMAEERYHGRAAVRLEKFRDDVLSPILKYMSANKVDIDDVNEYLKVAHAKQRNEQVLKVNPNNPSGSGITDDDADRRMAKLESKPGFAKVKSAADKIQAITKQRLDLLVDAGVMKPETREAMNAAYEYYVPLKQDEQGGAGQGFSVKGKEQRATGRYTEADNVIEHILQDYERAVITAEKNRVGQYMLNLVRKNQGLLGGMITLDRPDYKQTFRKGTAANPDGSVVLMPTPQMADSEAVVYVNGEPVRVTFRDELLANAYKNLGMDKTGAIVTAFREFNNVLSKLYTGYNPEFLFTNIIRDATSGVINLTGQQGLKVSANAIKYWSQSLPALAIWSAKDKKLGGEWGKWIDEYRDNGGSTGAAYLSDIERIGSELGQEYDDYLGAMELARQGKGWRAAKTAASKSFGRLVSWIEHANAAGENAFRVATYRAVKEEAMSRGMSEAEAIGKAASAAKNVTVNFNRKGEMTPTLGAAYLFFNPAVQGTAVLADTLTNSPHKYQAWALMGGLASLAMLARYMVDDDDWEKIPEYTKERNIIIPTGRVDGELSYVTLPLPYGHGYAYNIGTQLANVANGGSTKEAALNLGKGLVEQFSPVGNPFGEAKGSAINMLPTAAAILLRPGANVSGMGNEMYPESAFKPDQPDNEKLYRGTKGTVYDKLAQGVSERIGNKYLNDWSDVSPEVLKYWVSTLTGGTGRFIVDTTSLPMLGQNAERGDVPIWRKVSGKNDIRGSRQAYYRKREKAMEILSAYKAAKKAGDYSAIADIVSDKNSRAMMVMARQAEALAENIKARRDYQDEIRRSSKTDAEKRLLLRQDEAKEAKLYDLWLDTYKSRIE